LQANGFLVGSNSNPLPLFGLALGDPGTCHSQKGRTLIALKHSHTAMQNFTHVSCSTVEKSVTEKERKKQKVNN